MNPHEAAPPRRAANKVLIACLFVAGPALAWFSLARQQAASRPAPATPPIEHGGAQSRAAANANAAARAAQVEQGGTTPAPSAAPTVPETGAPGLARGTPGGRLGDFLAQADSAKQPSALTTDATPAAVDATEAESVARAALRFVGKDQAAEAIWLRAINDPSLPKGVRSDLIEDLNDEGYIDNNRATQADLPLIQKRLELIERLAPLAMDDVNRAAFEEAYKDLLAMLIRLRGEKPRT